MDLENAIKYSEAYPYIYILYGIYTSNYFLYYRELKKIKCDWIYMPAIRIVKCFDRYNKIVEKEEQIFPSYAFFLLSEQMDALHLNLSLENIYCTALSIEDTAAVVLRKDFIECIESVNIIKKTWDKQIIKGDRLQFTNGPFKNFTGIAMEDQKEDTVLVEIDNLFNRKMPCEFNVKNLIKL